MLRHTKEHIYVELLMKQTGRLVFVKIFLWKIFKDTIFKLDCFQPYIVIRIMLPQYNLKAIIYSNR